MPSTGLNAADRPSWRLRRARHRRRPPNLDRAEGSRICLLRDIERPAKPPLAVVDVQPPSGHRGTSFGLPVWSARREASPRMPRWPGAQRGLTPQLRPAAEMFLRCFGSAS
jgi:hypothetical protein